MWKSLSLTLFFFILLPAFSFAQQEEMNNDLMDKIFKEKANSVEGGDGVWQVHIGDFILLVITDESNNRMRIFTPIIEEKDMKEGDKQKMLEANFHSALDAKYGLYNDFVVSVFTHPLRELTAPQLIDAMYQVANLAHTYGTTFTSTGLIFGGGTEEGEEEEKRINQSPRKSKRS